MPLTVCDLIDDPNLGLEVVVENDLDRRVRFPRTPGKLCAGTYRKRGVHENELWADRLGGELSIQALLRCGG